MSGAALLHLAREAIEASFDGRRVTWPDDSWLRAPGAAFVTLRRRADSALRGCVGSIEARGPLGQAVIDAALGAAFRDPRFEPLRRSDLREISIEVSVLSVPRRLPVVDEADARRQLNATKPGVVLDYRSERGVLLPKVWRDVNDAGDFLRHLKRKAGLAERFWADDLTLSVFTCEEFAEEDVPVVPREST